jgi:hypothetical protein
LVVDADCLLALDLPIARHVAGVALVDDVIETIVGPIGYMQHPAEAKLANPRPAIVDESMPEEAYARKGVESQLV